MIESCEPRNVKKEKFKINEKELLNLLSNDDYLSLSINSFIRNKIVRFRNSAIDSILSITKDKIKKIFKNRYGFSFYFNPKNIYCLQKATLFISKIDKDFEKREKINNLFLNSCFYILNVEENTFIIIKVGNKENKSEKNLIISDDIKEALDMNIIIFGKYSNKYKNMLLNEINCRDNKNIKNLTLYNVSGRSEKDGYDVGVTSIANDLKNRELSTLFFNEGVKESIIKDINNFFEKKHIYDERSINFKTGILLYGEPGTGKSSLVNAIANEFGLNVISIDMNSFTNLDTDSLTSYINGDGLTYIVLLEDIDTVFNTNREDGNIDKEDKKIVNKLLQFLDSNSSPSNVIFIATTNYIDKLDPAVKREGRFDDKIYIGPIDKNTAEKMCYSFGCNKDQTNNILSEFKDDELIIQAKLQTKILKEFKEVNKDE